MNYYKKYIKYKNKHINFQKYLIGGNIFDSYQLIGIGDFSHGDSNIWTYRLDLLKKCLLDYPSRKITIFIEDTIDHTNNIMMDEKLIIDSSYGVFENKYPYGPLERYCIRSWDSKIFYEIIQFIRDNNIEIIGVNSPTQARDKKMAQTIIEKLNTSNINFFWAANAHVDSRPITESYELKFVPDELFRAGYYLKKHFKDKYLIIVSAAYEGEIRFNSICSNKDCDKRTFPEIPFFENFHIDNLKKYVTSNDYNLYDAINFKDPIVEFSDAKFPNDFNQKVYDLKTFDKVLFFSKSNKLELFNSV